MGKKKTFRIYGRWAGNPDGYKEDPALCIEAVWRNWVSGQCVRKRGHGPDGLYCKQHGKKAEAHRELLRRAGISKA